MRGGRTQQWRSVEKPGGIAMADGYSGTNGSGVIFTNVRILDGTGEYPYTGEVTVQGNRIRQVTKGSSRMNGGAGIGGQTVIDGMGATLMPGLCDAHRSEERRVGKECRSR